MTTWKNSGVTRANSCRKKEATITSRNSVRYLTSEGTNQCRLNGCEAPAPGRPRGCEQNEVAGPQCLELGQAEVSRPARPGRWTRHRPVPDSPSSTAASTRKAPSLARAMAGSTRLSLQCGRAYLLRPESQPPPPHYIAHGIFRGALAKPVLQSGRFRRHLVKLRDQRKTIKPLSIDIRVNQFRLSLVGPGAGAIRWRQQPSNNPTIDPESVLATACGQAMVGEVI